MEILFHNGSIKQFKRKKPNMIFEDLINNLNNNLRYQVSLVSGTREPPHPTFLSLQMLYSAGHS